MNDSLKAEIGMAVYLAGMGRGRRHFPSFPLDVPYIDIDVRFVTRFLARPD